jgi:hypothetical protein
MTFPLFPAVLAGVAAGAAYLGWRFFGNPPPGVTIQYPLASKIAYPLTQAQMKAAEGVESALIDNKVPPEIGAAILANFWAESKLQADAVGDAGGSVGVAQIYVNGGVAPYLSNLADRTDPYKSTVAMIRFMEDHKGQPTIPGASPGGDPAKAGPDPLTLYDNGVRDIERLTTAFRFHVERPRYSAEGVKKRERYAREMFPVRAVI